MNKKEEFLEIYALIQRPGADKLLAWLESSDFFRAPASTRFHGSFEGGLCQHSLNVYRRLCQLLDSVPDAPNVSPESRAICALLHDLCKVNFYGVEMRNRKNEETGRWEKVPFYTVDEKFHFGHGEKSVFLVERFMPLDTGEAVAIRYHMGAFREGEGADYAAACKAFPLTFFLHTADMMAGHFDEAAQ